MAADSQRPCATGFCHNAIPEIGDIPVSISTPFYELHLVVDAFHWSISDTLMEVVENWFPPVFQSPDELQKLVTAELLHFTYPCLQESLRLFPVSDMLLNRSLS